MRLSLQRKAHCISHIQIHLNIGVGLKLNFSLKIAITIQALAVLTILLDIPVARQIIGFVYVSFLPGFLILKLLKLNLKSIFEELPLSVGLSIAFSMFLGLVVNAVYPLFGVSAPLSVLPLLVTISAVLVALTVVGRNQVSSVQSYSLPSLKQIGPFAILPIVPLLSIFGALYHSSFALVLMAAVIAALVTVTIFFRKQLPTAFFPISIAVIALSLVFQSEFISQHIIGWDTFGEFYVFNSANTQSFWNAQLSLSQAELNDYNSMLSVTILPTIYSKLMNLQGEWVFKILYPLLFALVPLTMYQMYKQNFGKATAFLATFYFVLFPFFYITVRKQIIGELFLVLLLLIMLTSSISVKKKEPLIAIFGIALVVSHYSTFYVFIFFALFAWAAILIMEKLSIIKQQPLEVKKVLTPRVLLLIAGFAVFWYAFVSTSLAQSFIDFTGRLATSFMPGFSDIASRGHTVSSFVSPNFNSMTLTYMADYFISKILYPLIPLGLIVLVKNRKKVNIQAEYLPMAAVALLSLILTFALPSLADALVEGRWFNLLQIFIAPLCFYGGISALTWISKHLKALKQTRSFAIGILCVLLVTIFLFKVGFVYEVTGDTSRGASASFSFTQMKTSNNPQVLQTLYGSYVPDVDIYSAKWLSFTVPENATLYADADAHQHVLRGYASIVVDGNNILYDNITIAPNAYVYLRTFNTQGYFIDPSGAIANITQISAQLEGANKIYSSGSSEIYLSNVDE